MTSDEFYKQRDLRTALEVGTDVRLQARVQISIDESVADTFAGQLTFLSVVNLTARWCRNTTLLAPNVPVCQGLEAMFPGPNLRAAAISLAESVDPFGLYPDAPGEHDAAVMVSLTRSGTCLNIFGAGWLGCSGQDVECLQAATLSLNPLGPALAACLGASHLLRTVLGHLSLPVGARLSAWNLASGEEALDGPVITETNLGRTAIIGMGAIGGAIAYLWPLTQLRSKSLCLVDRDRVEISNLNRVPIFFAEDVGDKKVDVAARLLKVHGVQAETRDNWYSSDVLNVGEYDLVVPAANEHGFQPILMSNLPPLMIAGSTGDDWSAYFQRHIPIVEDCLECRLKTTGPGPAAFKCSDGELSPPLNQDEPTVGLPKTGAIPFLPLAAAVFAVAEMVKLGMEGQVYPSNHNCAVLSFLTDDYQLLQWSRNKKADCKYCWDPTLFRKMRAAGRYAKLSG